MDTQLFCPTCKKFVTGWAVLNGVVDLDNNEIKAVVNADGVVTEEVVAPNRCVNYILRYAKVPEGFFTEHADDLRQLEIQIEDNSLTASCINCDTALIWAENLADKYALIKTKE